MPRIKESERVRNEKVFNQREYASYLKSKTTEISVTRKGGLRIFNDTRDVSVKESYQ